MSGALRYPCLVVAALALGCGNATQISGSDGGGPSDAAGGGGDLAGSGRCSPACTAVAPVCNATRHCVACAVDADCAKGNLCKVLDDAHAVCTPGCKDDAGCGPGGACCKNSCVDTKTDSANCGACGVSCSGLHALGQCVGGLCQTGTCAAGFGDCNHDPKDGCEANLHTDANNCTACGMKCAIKDAVNACADGCYEAACNFGFDDCNGDPMDGCETSVLSDGANCGGCGKSCSNLPHAAAACMNAQCVLGKCDPGFVDCNGDPNDGCEANLMGDAKNCGKCGYACPNNLVCGGGVCTTCGNDCWGASGCITAGGHCIQFTCRAGSAGGNFCNGCLGWHEITYQQWMNGGYCADVIAKYRATDKQATHCGGQGMTCCRGVNNCGGGDNAWHFYDGMNNKFVGPCLGCANDVNCKYWDNVDNSAYTRISACER